MSEDLRYRWRPGRGVVAWRLACAEDWTARMDEEGVFFMCACGTFQAYPYKAEADRIAAASDLFYPPLVLPEDYPPMLRMLRDAAGPDAVCPHGTALDVHCCGCHSGFLFDADSCMCLEIDELVSKGRWNVDQAREIIEAEREMAWVLEEECREARRLMGCE